MTTERFWGRIAGVGTTSGVRAVVGRWDRSPFGAFADVMLEQRDGHRVLLAPTEEVARDVSATYVFDTTEVVEVTVTGEQTWHVHAGDLDLTVELGGRTRLGRLLRTVPATLAARLTWTRLIDPIARRVVRGVRTHGSAGPGRHEFYGAYDQHRLVRAGGTWRGDDLGSLAPVVPAVRFGFSSTPPEPSVTRVVTTIVSTEGTAR